MHCVVCIKQVPDSNDVKINPITNNLMREGIASIINPFDMHAIEEGLRLKARTGAMVTVISMGPPQAEHALREAIAMGADNGILVCDRAFAGSDTWATSHTLALALRKIGNFGLIICGRQASDGDTAQVGPGIAGHLDLPQITYVRKVAELTDQLIVAERMLEGGYETVESPLPCVITVVQEINVPRFPSLKGKMAARKAVIAKWTARDLDAEPDKLGLEGSPTRVVKVFTPLARSSGEMLQGAPEEIVAQLVEKLKVALTAAPVRGSHV